MVVIRDFNLKNIILSAKTCEVHIKKIYINALISACYSIWFIFMGFFPPSAALFYILLQFGNVLCLITSDQCSMTFSLELI